MTALPAKDDLAPVGAGQTGPTRAALRALHDYLRELPGLETIEPLVIAAGAVTPAKAVCTIDTEAGAATDDLTNIVTTHHPDGRFLWASNLASGKAVTVKHNAGGAGQIILADAADLTLSDPTQWLLLQRVGADWKEKGRFYGANKAGLRGFVGVDSTQGKIGQCRLVKNGANLELRRHGGRKLFIGGQFEIVPAVAPTLAPTGAAADTTYYIYAYMNAGVLTLERSTTAPATDATHGHPIKSGDGTRTLVGMARAVTGPAWEDSATKRFVRSWFNDPGILGKNAFSSSIATSSTSLIELSSSIRVEFLSWAGETVRVAFRGFARRNDGVGEVTSCVAFDGTAPEDGASRATSPAAAQWQPVVADAARADLAEGYHYATALGKLNTGNSSWAGDAANQDNRCSLTLKTDGVR